MTPNKDILVRFFMHVYHILDKVLYAIIEAIIKTFGNNDNFKVSKIVIVSTLNMVKH